MPTAAITVCKSVYEKNTNIDFLIFLFSNFYSSYIFADDSKDSCAVEVRDTVARYLKVESFSPISDGGVIVSESCKSWPYKDKFLLAVFAFDKGVEYQKSLFVAVLNMRTMDIVSSQQSIVDEDAMIEVGESSFQFDTARYQLTKDIRAFGLRFHSSAIGPSCADSMPGDELTLFVQEKNNLRSVLTMYMRQQNALSGCIGTSTRQDILEYSNKTISIEKTSTHDFNDLRIIDTVRVESNINGRVGSYLMKYDGKQYK